MPSPKLLTTLALCFFLVGTIGLTGALSVTAYGDMQAAAIRRARRPARNQVQRTRLLRRSGSSSSVAVCGLREECVSEEKSPPCASMGGACADAVKGKECGRDGTKVSYCYSCRGATWLDSSHHTCN